MRSFKQLNTDAHNSVGDFAVTIDEVALLVYTLGSQWRSPGNAIVSLTDSIKLGTATYYGRKIVLKDEL